MVGKMYARFEEVLEEGMEDDTKGETSKEASKDADSKEETKGDVPKGRAMERILEEVGGMGGRAWEKAVTRESLIATCELLLEEVELKGWMKPSVTKFVSDLFYRREGAFSEAQQGRLETVMGRLKNKFNALDSKWR